MDRLRNIPRPAHIPCPSPLLTDRVARVLYFEKLLRDHGPDPWVYTQLADTLQAESFSEGLRFYQEALALLAAREEDNLTELYEELDIMEAALEDDARASTMVFDNALVVQPWKSVRDHTFPEDIVSPPGMDTLRDTWKRHCLDGSELLQRYTSHWAISTQEIEGTFLLTSSSTQDLMRRGLTEGTVVAHPKSTMQDPASIQMILYDTLAAYELIAPIVQSPETLTAQAICDIHYRLMHTARFLPATLYQRYIPPGQTRSNTRRTVIVDLGTDGTGRRMKTDCCPYQRVDIELDEICERASKLLDDRSVHPFALASWLHVVLAGCHPFNDGNGRVCRLVASIPLIRAGYPMISVPLEHRDAYFRAIKKAHSGSHDALVESFVHGMLETLDKIQNI